MAVSTRKLPRFVDRLEVEFSGRMILRGRLGPHKIVKFLAC